MFLTTTLKSKPYKKEFAKEKEPLLCITFDDGNQSDVDIAYPYLKSKGLTATFVVVTSFIGNPNPIGGVYPREENQWQLYKQAIADGFELGCHTHTHRSLTEITLEEVHQEMQNVNQAFIAQGLNPPKHHAFPRALWNEDIVDVILQYRETVMRTGAGYIDYDTTAINRFPRVMPSEINNMDRFINGKKIVDNIIKNGTIGITVQHRISDDGVGGSRTDLWKEWVDYVAESGVRTVTMDEMYQILKDYKGVI